MADTVSKVVLGDGTVLIDLTSDTASADKVLSGYKFHDKSGAEVTGSCKFDADTSGDNATAAEILTGKTAHVRGSKVTGSMPNNAGTGGTISTKTGAYTIPVGYADGSGKVTIAKTEQDKIIPENIREGVTLLGVPGSMSGSEGMSPQSKSVTPSFASQEILPDSPDYNCLSSVTVAAIPVSYADNPAGGKTVTIG